MHVHAANIHDTKGGVYTFEKALYRYPTIIGARADQGYRRTFKDTFETFHNIKINISPRIKNEFEIQPMRWVVERTFAWLTARGVCLRIMRQRFFIKNVFVLFLIYVRYCVDFRL